METTNFTSNVLAIAEIPELTPANVQTSLLVNAGFFDPNSPVHETMAVTKAADVLLVHDVFPPTETGACLQSETVADKICSHSVCSPSQSVHPADSNSIISQAEGQNLMPPFEAEKLQYYILSTVNTNSTCTTVPIPTSSADLRETGPVSSVVPVLLNELAVKEVADQLSSTENAGQERKRAVGAGRPRKNNRQQQQQTDISTAVSANRLKQNLDKSAFEWDGQDMITKITNAFEFAPDALIQWFCNVCVRGDEDYIATGDEIVHVKCEVCKRTWHSQCYETEYPQDNDFWDKPDIKECYGCRAGWWKCMLCGGYGFENSCDADGKERSAEEVIHKCAETNCLARCHRKCVEIELNRPKTCFARTKQPNAAVRSKVAAFIMEVAVKTEEKPSPISSSGKIVQDVNSNPNSTTCEETDSVVGMQKPTNVAESDAASAGELPHDPQALPLVAEQIATLNIMVDTKISDVDIDNTSPPACASSSPIEAVTTNTTAENAAVDQQHSTSNADMTSQDSRRSSSVNPPSDIASTISTAGNLCSVIAVQQLNSISSTETSAVESSSIEATKPGAKRGRPRTTTRKSRGVAAVLPSANPASTSDAVSLNKFSFKCGRHECHVCKRLGRSVTCPTTDGAAAAAGGADTLCKSNVKKNGQFSRIALPSCLRCCRAAHFHPHCMPPTYLVNAYNPNFMLCEDHIFCEENPDVLAEQQMPFSPKTSGADETVKRGRKRKSGRKPVYRKKQKKAVDNDGKVLLETCSACADKEDKNSGNLFIACKKCAAVVHRCCLPTGPSTPVDAQWLCCIHDENEATSPIILFDAVWCKDGRYPWWPARVIPWEEVPEHLRKRNTATASGQYSVLYFQQELSGPKEYAFLHSGRVLPFEESQTNEAVVKEYRVNKKLHGSLLQAIEYYKVMQNVREVINSQTFQIFSASWEYQTISWNQPMNGVPYVRRGSGARARPATDAKKSVNDSECLQKVEVAALQPADDAGQPSSVDEAPKAASPKRGSQRERRTAAAKCTNKLVDYTEDVDDKLGSKCQCRPPPSCSGLIPCDPLTCLNAHGKIECDDKNCRLFPTIKCQNRRLDQLHAPPGCTKRYNNTLRVSNCGGKGKGLVTKTTFVKGDYIIEYVGEVITQAEQTRREKELFGKYDQPMFYFMSLDAKRVLDAQYKGNLSRFANHSCDPNAKISRVWWNGDFHIVLQAIRDIPPGEEITYNYDWGTKGKNPMACGCGAKNCAGVIGGKVEKKRKADAIDDKLPQKKRRKNGDKVNGKPSQKRAPKRKISAVEDNDDAAPAKAAGAKKPRTSKKLVQGGDNAPEIRQVQSNVVGYLLAPPVDAVVANVLSKTKDDPSLLPSAAVSGSPLEDDAALQTNPVVGLQPTDPVPAQFECLAGTIGDNPIVEQSEETAEDSVFTAPNQVPDVSSDPAVNVLESLKEAVLQQNASEIVAERAPSSRARRQSAVRAVAVINHVDVKSRKPKLLSKAKGSKRSSITAAAEEARPRTPESNNPNLGLTASPSSHERDRSRARLYPPTNESTLLCVTEKNVVVSEPIADEKVETVDTLKTMQSSQPSSDVEKNTLVDDLVTTNLVDLGMPSMHLETTIIETTYDALERSEICIEPPESLRTTQDWFKVKPPLPNPSPLPRTLSSSFSASSAIDDAQPLRRPSTRSQSTKQTQNDAVVKTEIEREPENDDHAVNDDAEGSDKLSGPCKSTAPKRQSTRVSTKAVDFVTPNLNNGKWNRTRQTTIRPPVITKNAAHIFRKPKPGVQTRKSSAALTASSGVGQENETVDPASVAPRRSSRRESLSAKT